MSKKIYDSLTELVGNTPLVRLHGYEKKLGLKAKLLAKVEYFNPIGSIKDGPYSAFAGLCNYRGHSIK